MKRALVLLLALALAFALAACRKAEPQPAAPEPSAPDAAEPLALDALDVEFSIGEREVDALLALQKAFPAALTEALAKQDVAVGTVNVTFGSSGEATSAALRLGTVQLAFLSMEDYLAFRVGEPVALERDAADEAARGVIVTGVGSDRFTAALRAALPDLDPVLADYAAGFAYDASEIEGLLDTTQQNSGSP